jgi:hypothetical protein
MAVICKHWGEEKKAKRGSVRSLATAHWTMQGPGENRPAAQKNTPGE